MATSADADAAQRSHPLFARAWAFAIRRLEPEQLGAERARLVAGLSGTVVEVGAGSGVMFAHYPPAVERVVGLEPEPYLQGEARKAAARAPVPVVVPEGDAEAIPLDDAVADAVVFALVLCSVPDQATPG